MSTWFTVRGFGTAEIPRCRGNLFEGHLDVLPSDATRPFASFLYRSLSDRWTHSHWHQSPTEREFVPGALISELGASRSRMYVPWPGSHLPQMLCLLSNLIWTFAHPLSNWDACSSIMHMFWRQTYLIQTWRKFSIISSRWYGQGYKELVHRKDVEGNHTWHTEILTRSPAWRHKRVRNIERKKIDTERISCSSEEKDNPT